MGKVISLGDLFAGEWWGGMRTECRECGYTNTEDQQWNTEVHTGGFGVVVIDVCPQCETTLKTRWSPS